MKVAVYTIALNEEQFVRRWFESSKDADYHLILDTGSTDLTRRIALELGVHVEVVNIKPWRFDMARNASLALLPDYMDYCISLDMDEVLTPGWRDALEVAHKAGITRPRYKYTWSWKPDGSPDLQYGGDKIHARAGYRWKHPVHETLTPYGAVKETQMWVDGLEIEHHPDSSKSRGQYFPMLEMAIDEDPEDPRNRFYYARELYYNQQPERAAHHFRIYLNNKLATWTPERAAAYRFLAKCEPWEAELHLEKAIIESPNRREAYVEMSQLSYENGRWQECYDSAVAALEIVDKPMEYLCEDFAWNGIPEDLAAISAYQLGMYDKALLYGLIAREKNPNDKRIVENLKYYTEKALPNTAATTSF